jgi:hypothetical protein
VPRLTDGGDRPPSVTAVTPSDWSIRVSEQLTTDYGPSGRTTDKSYERSDWRSHREAYWARISVVRD